jgi:hypothetical protein
MSGGVRRGDTRAHGRRTPSVLIVADDRDLAGRLAALVLRLGYRQTSVLPLTGSERAVVEGTVDPLV